MNIKEVARQAGVSISTVSRVINHTAKVSPEVKERVEAVIRANNYRPNLLARQLQQNRTNTIGVIMSVEELNMNSLSEAVNSIGDELKTAGYSMLFVNSRFHSEEELEFFHLFQEKRVDGILYFAAGFTPRHYEVLNRYPIPVVMIGQENHRLGFPSISIDDYEAAGMAANYLMDCGHRRIAYISCPSYDRAAGIRRREGFIAALMKRGLRLDEDYMYEGDFSIEGGHQGMKGIIEGCKKKGISLPSAVFAATDYMAIGAMHYLHGQGFLIPEEISVMGFDDVNVSAYMNPPLTTVSTNKKELASQAVRLLLDRIAKDEEARHLRVDFELKERDSVIKL